MIAWHAPANMASPYRDSDIWGWSNIIQRGQGGASLGLLPSLGERGSHSNVPKNQNIFSDNRRISHENQIVRLIELREFRPKPQQDYVAAPDGVPLRRFSDWIFLKPICPAVPLIGPDAGEHHKNDFHGSGANSRSCLFQQKKIIYSFL